MHKLLAHQLRNVTRADGSVDAQAFIAIVERSYGEFDRERRLNDRAAKLMEEELKAANDITRRCAEKKLIEALEAAPCAVALLDAGRRVQNANSAMCEMLGRDGADACASIVGSPFYDLIAGAAPDIGEAELLPLREGKSVECPIGGSWYLGAAHRMSDGSVTVAFSNITALKERETASTLARDAAEYANRVKSEFMATMSHELRTPLNAILGFSEIIRDNSFGTGDQAVGRYSDYAASIHASGRHLLELISDILDLSKIEAGSFEIHPEMLDLSGVVETSLALVRPQAERGRIRLQSIVPAMNRMIEADPRAIKQAIVNLLSNAVKFTPADGEVETMIQSGVDGVTIRVRDTGIGIAPQHLKRVFDPFYQADAHVARSREGTGLGLAITKKLIECHGGTIALESRPGKGTCAIVRLPWRVAQRETAAGAVSAA